VRRWLAIAAVAASAFACHRSPETPGIRSSDTPVFIISIDTLRSDHLPAYGYAHGSTPAIDAFRRDSILFANAFSQVPQTLPSHTTIMTGLLPQNHGVRDNVGYVLPGQTPTIAGVLRQNGWQTGAAVSAYVLRRSTGIAEGFDFYDDQVETAIGTAAASEERNGDLTRKSLEHWLEDTPGKVFAFLHLYEPHAPYTPPPAFAAGRSPYDGEVSYADAIVGRFLDTLRARGLYNRSLIVLLSDHGEGLGEHGEDEHGVFLYRYALQVPLLVKLPQSKRHGETVTAPVALTDIAPTVFDCVGIVPPKSDGSTLLGSHLDATRQLYAETWYPRLHLGWSELTSLIDAHAHYIHAPHSELYAWQSDRSESNNMVAAERRVASAMSSALDRQSRPFNAPSSIDPEDQKKLAALGYVGSTQASGPLPDPKEKIGSLHEFKVALQQFTHGDDGGCRRTLRALLGSDPAFIDAYGLLAQSERRSGNTAAAIDALKAAMTRAPADSHIALALADALWVAGEKQQAREHAQLATRDNPALAHELLATFAFRDGKLAAARSEVDAALATAPDRVQTLLLAATIADHNGNYEREIALLDRVVEISQSRGANAPKGTQKQRGDVLLHLQKVADAEAAFRAETSAYPQNRDAWTSLAAVLAAEGRRGEAEQTLRAALEKNPDGRMRALAEEAAVAFNDAAFARELRSRR
jgi:tetratricopeptide (TPR) repeat protein